MSTIQRVSSGAKWEEIVGYSRAIKVGNVIEIAGTTAIDEQGQVVGVGDAYAQTRYIIEKARTALKALKADLQQVIRTRMYVTDITQWEEVGRAHGDFFRDIKPVATMVEVSRLIHPELVVEIEFSAVVLP